MLKFPTPKLSRILPLVTFEQLCDLWQQMADKLNKSLLLGEEDLVPEFTDENQSFRLLLASNFRALLLGKPKGSQWQISLIFESEVIISFARQVRSGLQPNFNFTHQLQALVTNCAPNDSQVQSEFTLELITIISAKQEVKVEADNHRVVACQPFVDKALERKLEQERLLHQVVTQIRQSLDLKVILSTAVAEARSFLQVDRLVIYEFGHVNITNATPTNSVKHRGKVTYESIASEEISSVLHLTEEQNCSVYIPNWRGKYHRGITVAVNDISTAYQSSHCLYEFLKHHQVQAQLIAPIVVKDNLWGLLIAHQCLSMREWEEREEKFLGEIAENLSVAIYQAQLYAQVQKQKQTLEQRVIERTEELRDAMLAAQSASRSKSEFLAAMSHELRTPLTCIIGLASTLLHWYSNNKQSSSLPVEKQQRYLDTIHNSGQQLLALINDILDVAQIEAGKIILNLSDFSLQQLSQEVVRFLREDAFRHQIDLQLDLQFADNEDTFCADLSRVKQILFNLLGNAIKFTPPEGEVLLRVWQEENQAIFQVEDTGIGIPENKFHLLFEKFQQLETTHRRTYNGTGLGLALTKQLVELHGGIITVESTVGEGSVFTVRLPHQGNDSSRLTTPKVNFDDAPFFSKGTLVLLERNDELATVICELLTAANYQVVWLMDGASAISQIELLKPKVVILDLELLDLEMEQLNQTLKNSPATEHIKLLVLSSQIKPANPQECQEMGGDDFVLKPIRPQILLQKVNKLVKES